MSGFILVLFMFCERGYYEKQGAPKCSATESRYIKISRISEFRDMDYINCKEERDKQDITGRVINNWNGCDNKFKHGCEIIIDGKVENSAHPCKKLGK